MSVHVVSPYPEGALGVQLQYMPNAGEDWSTDDPVAGPDFESMDDASPFPAFAQLRWIGEDNVAPASPWSASKEVSA